MRLFVAVPLPTAAGAEVAAVLANLRDQGWPVRWIKDEAPHLTLKFFGEVTPDRVDAIAEMLDFATRDMAPVVMTLSGASVFPSAERPRVLCLGVDAESGLELLQDRIERGAEPLGFPPEGRPFRPHITLGRVREGHRLPAGWQNELKKIRPGEAFLGDRIVLFVSELGPSGPAYRIRHEVRLG